MKFHLPFSKSGKFEFWRELAKIIFRISFITFLILMIIEYIEPGFGANWFNPLWLLIIVIISAIISITKEKR